MTTLDPTILDADELARMLRAWAKGIYHAEAATELVIRHSTWLHRPDFLHTLVDAAVDEWSPEGVAVPVACVDWDSVEDFVATAPACRSEIALLRLAASIAGAQTSTSLREITGGLDDTNSTLVLEAIAHRFGWHERGKTQLVTGTFATSTATSTVVTQAPSAPAPARAGRRD